MSSYLSYGFVMQHIIKKTITVIDSIQQNVSYGFLKTCQPGEISLRENINQF